jgi:hypothetical protein
MKGLTEGRIVHYVMPDGEHRAAIVVKVWDHEGETGCANLQIFTDGTNDLTYGPNLWWKTSVLADNADKKIGTWHWIEPA